MVKLSKLVAGLVFCGCSLMANDVYGPKSYTETMKKYLISAEEAIALVGKENVVFVSGDSHETYEEIGHINGSKEMYAHHLHHADETGHMHCAPLFMCPKEAEEYISSKGIKNDSLVIGYDNYRGPNATGVFVYFKSFGHENVKILNGGMDALKAIDPAQIKLDKLKNEEKAVKKEIKETRDAKKFVEARALEEKAEALKNEIAEVSAKTVIQKGKEPKWEHSAYKIDESKIDLNMIADKNEVLKASNDIVANGKNSNYVIIDTRGFDEIMGEKKLDNVARGGHVPGAKLIEWKNFTDNDNKLSYKKLEELQAVFDRYGVKKGQTIYAYCHVGAGRSTHITTALKMLGYDNVKVYTGSWDEWGNDQNLPINR